MAIHMLDFCATVNMSIRNAQSTQSAIYFIYENAIVSCRPTSYASYIHGSLCLALCCIVFFLCWLRMPVNVAHQVRTKPIYVCVRTHSLVCAPKQYAHVFRLFSNVFKTYMYISLGLIQKICGFSF